jgi:molybdate transport system substrate-binding protein
MRVGSYAIAAAILGAPFISGPTNVNAAEIIILANQGAVSAVRDLAPAFARTSGHKVIVQLEVGPAFMQKINSDAPAHVVTTFVAAFDDLIKRGKVVEGSVAEFARAGNGVAVKAGAPKPDISTAEAFKRAMLAAKSIGHSSQGTGPYNTRLFQRLGIYDQIKDKIKIIQGRPVVSAVAAGEVEIGIQQTNVIQPYPGADYVGPLPPELIEYGRFAAGVLSVSKDKDAARALVKFMADPANEALVRKSAMEPPAR